jgi:hypothetical protein
MNPHPSFTFAAACWPFAVGRVTQGRLEAVPLASVAALEADGFRRKQVAEWAPRCAAGRLRIFSLRDQASGRRLGYLGLRCLVESKLWVLEFHSLRPNALRSMIELLVEVQVAYQEKTGGKPHAALGSAEAVRSLREQMDLEDAERAMDDQRSGVVLWQSDAEPVH